MDDDTRKNHADTRKVSSRRNESQRLQSTRELSRTRTQESLDQLIERLRDESKAVQDTAHDALVKIGGDDVIKALVPILDSEDTQYRNLAINILGNIGMDAPEHLYKVIESGNDDAKIFTLDIFGVLGDERSVEPMSKAFKSENVNVRNACAMAMSRIASPKTIPHLMRALEDDEWVRFSAIEGLASSGAPEVIDALVDKLQNSRDKDYYSGILECFVQMKHPKTITPLLEELMHVDVKHHNTIIEALVELIPLQTAKESVPQNLADALIPTLQAELDNTNPWCVFRTLEIIRWLADRRYTAAVFDTLKKGNELAQAGAARALEILAIDEDIPQLEEAMKRDGIAVAKELATITAKLVKPEGDAS